MNVRNLILLGVSALAVHTSAVGSVIDDKSQFVGDYTVIDFETRGDGTPLTEWFSMFPEEYAELGVSISLADPPHEFARPFVTYVTSPTFIAAQEIAGSPLYVLLEVNGANFLRFDFATPVNAVGLTVLSRSDHGLIEFEAYNASGLLIEEVFFLDDVIDGTILGSDYGHVHDVDYGFFGVFTPETEIAYALVRVSPHTGFDDLHFGVIPDPTTGVLLIAGVLGSLKRRRRWPRVNLRATGSVIVLIVAGASSDDIGGHHTYIRTFVRPVTSPPSDRAYLRFSGLSNVGQVDDLSSLSPLTGMLFRPRGRGIRLRQVNHLPYSLPPPRSIAHFCDAPAAA